MLDNIFLKFNWVTGSINDNIINHCKENNIDFRYNHYFKLEVNSDGEWKTMDYNCKDGIATITFN